MTTQPTPATAAGRALRATDPALAEYGIHHWDACNGLVDDYWLKCDCGLVQAITDIEAEAATPTSEREAAIRERVARGSEDSMLVDLLAILDATRAERDTALAALRNARTFMPDRPDDPVVKAMLAEIDAALRAGGG